LLVSVAIPVRNGGRLLLELLDAVGRQALPAGVSCEIVACDSGSSDGSLSALRGRGVEVFPIGPAAFSHGGTRNLLMERTRGELVAFLTQDAVPADDGWLGRLIGAFDLAPDVGLAFGPYFARETASPMVRRELAAWFAMLAPDGAPRIDRLTPGERSLPASALYGARGYFTDANGCVARAAWERVPFRAVAHDMLRAGYAKVFVPAAGVIHSHDYSPLQWVRRSFDEARAVADLYGLEDLGDLSRLARGVRGSVAADLRIAGGRQAAGAGAIADPILLARSVTYHGARALGTALGARARRLPRGLVRRLSLERRG
jgi:rhamnosyltransferase